MKITKLDLGHEIFANCYAVVDEASGESAIIDPAYFNERIMQMYRDAGATDIRYILLTHGHFDHIFDVAGLKEASGAKVVIHKNDAGHLLDSKKSLADGIFPEEQIPVEADITLEGGEVLYLGESRIEVMHTPGHTRGGVCYVLPEDRVIFSGDTLFCMTAGRTDFFDGDEATLVESLKKLVSLDGDYRVLPGHNRETTLERERTRNWFIRRMVK